MNAKINKLMENVDSLKYHLPCLFNFSCQPSFGGGGSGATIKTLRDLSLNCAISMPSKSTAKLGNNRENVGDKREMTITTLP
jgi:hypothetical protein